MRPPAIVYVHNRPIPATEANAIAVMHMCAALAAQGAAVRLVTFGGDRSKDPFAMYGLENTFAVTRLPPLSGPLSYPALLTAALAGARSDAIVYTRNPQLAVYASLARRRVILEMHYPISELRRGRWALKHLNRRNNGLVGVVAINAALRERLGEELPNCSAPIIVLPTVAVDLNPNDAFQKPFDIGFIGSFYQGRGVELILSLAAHYPQKRFLLVGGPHHERLLQKAGRLQNVTLQPTVDHREVKQILSSFEIGLAPYGNVIEIANSPINTVKWMSPTKIVEYMSARKVIVATKLPAIEELVTDGQDGLLADAGALHSWTSALDRLDSATLRKSLSDSARAKFLNDLSWDSRARKLSTAFLS